MSNGKYNIFITVLITTVVYKVFIEKKLINLWNKRKTSKL